MRANTAQAGEGKFSLGGSAGSKKSSVPPPVGVDDGHWGTKVCAGRGVFYTLPSRATTGRATTSAVNGDTDLDRVYETAKGEYITITADDMLGPADDTRTNDYPTSSTNRALVYHAMRKAGLTGAVSIVSGLPVNRFYVGGERNTPLIEAKRESLLRPVTCASGAEVPHVVGHKVISEAVAAYYDALFDFKGNCNAEFKEVSDEEPIATLDLGGRTLDVATIKERGEGIYQPQSGSADAGVLYLYDLLDKALRQHFQIQDPIPLPRLERTIKEGTIRIYGQKHDVRDIVAAQLDAFADRVSFEAKKFLGDASRFGRVLFVGGGANMLISRLGRIFPDLPPEAVTISPVDDNPQTNSAFANARGMYKAALVSAMNSN